MNPFKKLGLVLLLFIANAITIFLTRGTEITGYLIFSFCVVLFPILVLSIVDALRHLRQIDKPKTLFLSIFATLLSLPSLIMGLMSLAMGVTIVAWVLYNLIVERLPQYTGPSYIESIASFGAGFPLIFLGWRWIRLALGDKNA